MMQVSSTAISSNVSEVQVSPLEETVHSPFSECQGIGSACLADAQCAACAGRLVSAAQSCVTEPVFVT